MMEPRTYRLWAEGDEYTLPYRFLVGFYPDVVAAIRSNGDECPDETYAASYTNDHPEDPDDGQLYFPHDVDVRIIAHEAAHAVIGLYSRLGLTVPSRGSDDEDEEMFVHTIGTLTGQIHDAATEEEGEGNDGVGER